jgi:thiamine biosynthesis lipoprotein
VSTAQLAELDRPVATADWTAWTCRVRLAVTDPAALPVARALLTDRLAAVDQACSRFRSDSELSAVDAGAGRWTPVGPLLAEALAVALRAARLTDGDVDPTVGGALTALGYDRDLELVDPGQVPPSLAPVAGWRTVELDGNRVRIPWGARLDLGATAKSWTADRAADEITRATGAGALVSIGGDVAVAGPAPAGGWRIRVEDVTGDPDAPAGPGAQVVVLADGGLATSGTRARRWQRGGVEVHHLLDPRTGLPAAPAWRTVSVAAGSCLDANTASTAAVVRGRAALPWLTELGLPARLVAEDGAVLTTAGWPA